jgi:outer membrane murein-binding lipoprotein Lpp
LVISFEEDYTTIPLTRIARYDANGHRTKVINSELTGLELRINIDFSKACDCCEVSTDTVGLNGNNNVFLTCGTLSDCQTIIDIETELQDHEERIEALEQGGGGGITLHSELTLDDGTNPHGTTKTDVGLSNVDNTSDVNKPISTATQSAITLKQDRANSIYSNTYYLNAGVNNLSSVLTSIGSLTSTAINISPSGHSDTQNPVIVSKVNLCLVAPDCAFASPATTFNFPLTVNGSTSTRNLFNNIQFAQNFIIDGTLGRHSFKGCSFLQNFTLQNATTNWIFFYYCSFSGQVTIPSTFAGYIIFYFCDFNGATLNFNNTSNQQIYINSCNNLPSFSLNALLSGFNTTTTSSSISSVSLNVSGSVSMPSNSISQSSVNGLSSSLSTINTNITNLQTDNTNNKSNITDLQTDNTSNKSRLTSLENDNNTNKANITSLQSNKSDISYVDNKVNTAIQSLINSSPSTLDTLNELATALGNDPNFATTVTNNLASKANQTDLTTTNNNLSTLSTNLTNNYYDKTSADTLLFGKVDNSTLTSY